VNSYFAKPVGRDTPIKIGCSEHPELRIQSLRWKGQKCELLAVVWTNVEGGLHAKFADWHEGGEWFTANPELLEFISTVQKFNQALRSLPIPRRLTPCGKDYKGHIGKFADVEIAA
jgi:hypothetical protein